MSTPNVFDEDTSKPTGRVSIRRVGVVGAGTMGAGIAQLAAMAGLDTYLTDSDPAALAAGAERVRDALARGTERGRWSTTAAEAASARLRDAGRLDDLAGCDLVVEAVSEDLELKRAVLARVAQICGDEAILATNTSSLSVTAIAAEVPHPERVCGIHFFNPPPLMRLVEVVAGDETSAKVLDVATETARALGREPIRTADSVGFVANRCVRPFTLESLRMLGEGLAEHHQIDWTLREDGGYRMGPFELMDLIGIDVNLSVARSFYAQRPEPRWEPHRIQERMVAEGRLGRKTGRGFYEYTEGVERTRDCPPDGNVRRTVLDRVVCQLVNEASFAADEGVATREDIDAAMRLGFNHPRGPFQWLDELGANRVVTVLDGLAATLHAERYRVAASLRKGAG